jgi:hypothetical protein
MIKLVLRQTFHSLGPVPEYTVNVHLLLSSNQLQYSCYHCYLIISHNPSIEALYCERPPNPLLEL